ncbi:hypothetical protein VNI00_017475 [Paramarasmius palmivorus]|uniref:Nephrocystin 3-like N-terminal domain-containing protein n=1 Tax=Paramarasmius palmivorus TaxID=297713 RepID=A0AAW0B767_9AGAR
MSFNLSSSSFATGGPTFNFVHGNQINIHSNHYGEILLSVSGTHVFTGPTIFRLVSEAAAANAFYDSEQRFPPPNCHEGTRTEILQKLREWTASGSQQTRLLWLHGPIGCGKSAIAQVVSEQHAITKNAKLAASFFFSRNDSTRNNLDPFVATIIDQFLHSPQLRHQFHPLIEDVIKSDPKIFDKSFETQFEKLILEPCTKIRPEHWKELPNLIVIEALDECVDIHSQGRLLRMIRIAIGTLPACPFIFLLTSRPESHILEALSDDTFEFLMEQCRVGYVGSDDDADISRYLRDEFGRLRSKLPILGREGESWPGEDVVNELVRRAHGQFIFAVTVIRYVDTRDEPPQDRLDAILHSQEDSRQSESPYPALDLTYLQLLAQCRCWDKVRSIIRLLVTPHHDPEPNVKTHFIQLLGADSDVVCWRSLRCIALLLGLTSDEIRVFLIRLHSIIEVPTKENVDIRIYYPSFVEFLLDPIRSREYHVPILTQTEYLDLLVQTSLGKQAELPSLPTITLPPPSRTASQLFPNLRSYAIPFFRDLAVLAFGCCTCLILMSWQAHTEIARSVGCGNNGSPSRKEL